MIYLYKSISPQPIELLSSYMDFYFSQLFKEVNKVFNFKDYVHPDFEKIVKGNTILENSLTQIVEEYFKVNTQKRNLVKRAYNNNNDIENICDNSKRPVKFPELPLTLQVPLKSLYGSKGILYNILTSHSGNPEVKAKCGTLKKHFENFRVVNDFSVCPFCGMESLITEYELSKNEYDHYISKGDYPFCSINFKNLVPICDYCNKSGNKGQKDISFLPNTTPPRQSVIYFPYSIQSTGHEIKLEITSKSYDLTNPATWELKIKCNPQGHMKRSKRWNEIYNIETRYKGKITKDSYKWKNTVLEKYRLLCKKNSISFEDFKKSILLDYVGYQDINNGIIMKHFYEFLLNDQNCESYLNGSVTI